MKTSLFNIILLINTIPFFGLHAQTPQKPLITFGIVADVQYADQINSGTRFYRSSLEKLDDAVKVFNERKVDFVVSLGDFINDDLKSYGPLTKITDRLRMPLYHVYGNHDFAVGAENLEKLPSILHLKQPYHSFSKKGWRFIVLNGSDVSLFANLEGTLKYQQAEQLLDNLKKEHARNAQTWNGAIGEEQLTWLRNELENAQKKKEEVLVYCHYPLYPEGASELLLNYRKVRALLENYPCVFSWLNGHDHVSRASFENGVHYVSFRGMVEKEDNAFAIVSVYKDMVKIDGYGKEVSRELK